MAESRFLGSPVRLSTRLGEDLRGRIRSGEFPAGSKLPTEAVLVKDYGVSRSTVRQALKGLEAQGIVVTRHGRGSFVAADRGIHAGIQQLRSISETIAEQGFRPGMHYHSVEIDQADPTESDALSLATDDQVVRIRRSILADDVVVAYSYDALPRKLLGPEHDGTGIQGSLFAFLQREAGVVAVRATAQVHAICSETVGWETDETPQLYVVLDQVHFDLRDRPVLYSKTYFIEGRFKFVVIRN
ncbi:MAG: GntR family transcriptional regulator [Actinomycetota bacterium]|nr:GntR family transcriptional regulator [Actinomycetota bacterium]